jgi:hypothetical protein
MNSASLCSLAGRCDNPLPPRFLAPIASLKIPARYVQYSLCLVLSHPCSLHSTFFFAVLPLRLFLYTASGSLSLVLAISLFVLSLLSLLSFHNSANFFVFFTKSSQVYQLFASCFQYFIYSFVLVNCFSFSFPFQIFPDSLRCENSKTNAIFHFET